MLNIGWQFCFSYKTIHDKVVDYSNIVFEPSASTKIRAIFGRKATVYSVDPKNCCVSRSNSLLDR